MHFCESKTCVIRNPRQDITKESFTLACIKNKKTNTRIQSTHTILQKLFNCQFLDGNDSFFAGLYALRGRGFNA